jgi:hypothetical protein
MRPSNLWPAAAVVLGVAVVACSAGPGTPTVPSAGGGPTTPAVQTGGSSSGGTTPFEKFLAYAQCMRTHGLPNFPDPVTTPSGGYGFHTQGIDPHSPAFHSAGEACNAQAPEGWGTGGQPLSPAQQQQWLNWAKCVRVHGAPDFPDPTFSAGGAVHIAGGGGAGIPPQVQSAMNACTSRMPSSGGLGG